MLRWDAITHLHQAINPLIVSAAGAVAPSTPASWPEPLLIEAAHGNQSDILVPVHMSSKDAAELFFAKSRAEVQAGARSAVAAARSAGYDGISVDIEGLKPGSKDGFETFVAACADALAATPPLQLVVTLYITKLYHPSQPSAYNLTKLAVLADQVFLMGYDMTWSGAQPGSGAHEAGPNSPLDGLSIALATAIDVLGAKPASLLLGLPLYGRLYNCDGASPPAHGNCSCATDCKQNKGISLMMAAASGPGCSVGWEAAAATPFFDCRFGSNISSGGPPAHVRQQGWFEDGRSIAAKLQLASERGVGGVALWSAHGCPNTDGECDAIWQQIFAYVHQGPAPKAPAPAPAPAPPSPPPLSLFGLTRVRNSASCSGAPSGCTQLVRVNATSGELTNVGGGHTPIAATGDLAVLDKAAGVFYYLGDGLNGSGTVLVGISTQSGAQTCLAPVAAIKAEVGVVGGEQSLILDAPRKRLIIVGPAPDADGSGHYHHAALTAALNHGGGGTACPGPFEPLTTFGDADYEPIAHGTGFDAKGQRLFVTVSSGAHSYAMAIVDLTKAGVSGGSGGGSGGGSAPTKLVPMPNGTSCMWGPNWEPSASMLYGVGARPDGPGIDWRSLDVAKGVWSSRPLGFAANASAPFTTLWGNLGSVRAFDAASSSLYILVAKGRSGRISVARVDVASGVVTSHAPLHGDVGWSGEVLLAMAA